VSLKVTHTFGRNAGAVQTLEQRVVRFGRSPDNDVVFDPDYDRDASGSHAEVRHEGGGWVLVDLRSRNGTFVGGQRVERYALMSGDEVTFGLKGPRVRIEFSQGASGDPTPAPPRGGARNGGDGRAPKTAAKKPLPGTSAFAIPPGAAAPPPAPPPPARAPPPPARAPQPGAPGARPPYMSGPVAARPPYMSEPVAARPPYMSAPFPAPGMGAPVPAPPAGKRVGQRTIAMLISSAVAAARGRGPQKMNTRVLSDYVDRQVGAATAGQKRTTVVLAVMLLFSLAGLGGLILWSTRSSDEIDRLRGDLASLSPDDPRRKDIEGRLGSLHPANASFGRNLYDQSRKGIFMLAAGGQGFCTAFAVRPSVLATNAHCVIAARKHGGTIVALENEGRGDVSFPVSDMRAHPGYRENDANALTPDVGIVNINGRAATVLAMATELGGIGAGDDVYLIGFPGRLMDTSNPAATFLAAHVGRVTTAGGRPGSFGDTWLIQHDAPTTHGTSGSPIFNGKGKVIAINSGGYLEGDAETISGRKTEVVKASPYKFGMRIDLLNAVLR
jgi:hypothetical protein